MDSPAPLWGGCVRHVRRREAACLGPALQGAVRVGQSLPNRLTGVPFMQSFAVLGVWGAVPGAPPARGIPEPFAIQRLVVPDVLAGRDVLAKSPTGSGKTLAFGVPIVARIHAT